MKLFNREEFSRLADKYERAKYLLNCDKGVAMIATMKDLVPVSCEPTVVVMTDEDESISLNFTAPEDDAAYTSDDLIELANDHLREIVNSRL